MVINSSLPHIKEEESAAHIRVSLNKPFQKRKPVTLKRVADYLYLLRMNLTSVQTVLIISEVLLLSNLTIQVLLSILTIETSLVIPDSRNSSLRCRRSYSWALRNYYFWKLFPHIDTWRHCLLHSFNHCDYMHL